MINNIPFSFKLILTSLVFTIGAYIKPDLYMFGLNHSFIDNGNYLVYSIQLFTSVFLHGDLIHFLFNSIFIYIFGTSLELLIGRKKFIIFFIFIVLFNGVLLTYFSGSSTNTIGMSGFCMAILSYYVLELRSKNNNEYKGGITAIIINLFIGFLPGISLLGHLFGVIGGVLYYYYNKEFFKPKFVGKIKNSEL
ncbi:MAG: rhomboid family intramembrane serine protease [Candidatus Gracilibacteria bacterium]|nr:rhomboid family intramembrane serine protease [Candidatus Gracilibacteria bacterium]